MVGYAGDPERNAEAMEGGYYHTGDVGSRDADGYVTYVGRADDVFKSSDYRISPFEIESVMVEYGAIAEAAVVPSPDALRLAVPKAFIVLKPDETSKATTAEAIMAWVAQRVAPHKRIRHLEFIDQVPKSASGKILRRVLMDRDPPPRV
jgi:acetyl-CoA synthetase